MPTSSMRPVARTLVATLATILLFATGCGSDEPPGDPIVTPVPVPTADTAATPEVTSEASADPIPTATEAAPSETAPTETAEEATLLYFLLREGGERLWIEPVTFTYDPAAAGGAVARTALTELLAASPSDGLVQPVPAGTQLLGVEIVDRVLRIDLSGEVETNPGSGAAGEEAFAQALAHTGAQFSTVDAVQLLVDGEEVADLWGHLDWSAPIVPDEFAIVPIHIATADGIGGGGGSIELTGTANTFEATFDIEVRDAGGNSVVTDFVMASCGSGCRGEWTHTVTDLGPGTWTVVAREQDASDGEGFAPFEVSLDVVVPG